MEEKKNKRVESLGWLTDSAVMPKKQKAIGVGIFSIVELRAQLYKIQEKVKRTKDAAPDKNSSIKDRAQRGKRELKATNDGSASYAALENKAELYAKLVLGELLDDEEKEKYSVDFLKKGALEDEFEQLEGNSKDGCNCNWYVLVFRHFRQRITTELMRFHNNQDNIRRKSM